MSNLKFVNLARLMTTYNFEIEQLPDNLKCVKCKLVLKDACLVSCGCTFCRICIDDMISNGVEFCPGDSEDCGESLLTCSLSDIRANNKISRLTVKCPNNWCVHEFQLANIEEHLTECQRDSVECDFHKLEDINGHLLQENGMVANISKEIEILKQKDEDSKREIEELKHELVLKDGQIKTIFDKMIHLENENKSIAQGKEDLADRVRILEEKLDEELNSARVIKHVDREIATITAVIGTNKDELATEIKSVRDDILSKNQVGQSITDDIYSLKSREELIQALAGQVDARYEFVIVEDLSKVSLGDSTYSRMSEFFTGVMHPYRYRLSSNNIVGRAGYLQICLLIYPGRNDEKLKWPFEGRVVVIVADKDRGDATKSISRQCRIDRPEKINYKSSDALTFLHSELISARLDLSRGVRVSCFIIPGAGR